MDIQERFMEMYDRYFDRLYGYIYRRTGDVTVAEDLTSDVFLKALRHADKLLEDGNDPLPWLYTVATNEVNSYFRKCFREVSVDPEGFAENLTSRRTPEKVLIEREEEAEKQSSFERLRECMKMLSPEDQMLISLRFFEDLSYADISKMTGKSEGALRVKLHRALKNLKKRMEEQEDA